jgi:hypothetical protein
VIAPAKKDSTVRWCYLALGAFTLLLVAGFVLGDGMAPAGRRLAKVTGIDPPAYFGVSHALLFHQDFDLSEEYQRVKPDDSPWTARRKETGHYSSAYAVGYSILAAPFLAAGTLMDALAGNPATGYSGFAILGYCLANVVLTGLALMSLFAFTRNVAEFWGSAPRTAALYALFTTGAIFFGTSVGYYAFSPMSHATTFFCASLFLAYWWRVRERTDVRSWVFLGLLGGFLSITRWQDIFFLTAPILADLLGGPRGLLPRVRSRIAYGAAAALCWTPQVVEWKYIYGKFLTVPQGEGFFVFPPPFIPQVLFSTRNGWVMWTPLVLLGVSGLIVGARRKARLLLPWIVVIALEIGLIGSLPTTWHGGEGFSARYLTSNAPLIALGLVTLLCLATRNVRFLVMGAALVFCLFSVVSAVEFRLDLIPRADRLTASEYFTDKLRPLQVRRRKQMLRQAEALLSQGSPAAAAAVLEAAAADGPDRDILVALSKAYRASGREPEARNADQRLTILMQSRLF